MASLYDDWLDARARLAEEESAATVPTPPAPEPTSAPAPEPATDAIGRRLRHDGWTPERRRAFLQAVAAGATVTGACRAVGLTTASAYALRDRADGAAFALGWAAANLRAREPLADALLTRAVNGQVEWRANAHGERVERFRYDNGLATRMLARLDRDAAADGPVAAAAARVVAGEFDAYLDALGRDEGPARAGLFLAARAGEEASDLDPVRALARADRFARVGAALPGEVHTADLDLATRDGWTAEQWQRADAAGLLAAAPNPEPEALETSFGDQEGQLVTADDTEEPVWWDEDVREWRTSFPPPPGFAGWEDGVWEDGDYARALSDDERRAVAVPHLRQQLAELAAAEAERDQWFATAVADGGPRAPCEMVSEDEWLDGPDDAAPLGRDAPSVAEPDMMDPPATAPETAAIELLVTPALSRGPATCVEQGGDDPLDDAAENSDREQPFRPLAERGRAGLT